MSSELFADAGKIIVSAVIGGALTAAAALPAFNIKLTRLSSEMDALKDACSTCRSGVDNTLVSLQEKVRKHHEDDDKHNNKASNMLLTDILTRVMRIEGKLFNGSLNHKTE